MEKKIIIPLNISEWILGTGIYICYFLIVLIPVFLTIWTPSKTAKYLEKLYKKNWNSNYITNIELIDKDKNCSSNFTLVKLGYWSGVEENSCLCSNGNYIQFAMDKCKKKKYKKLYTCRSIPFTEPIELNHYKEQKICIKRSVQTINVIDQAIRTATSGKNYQEAINYLINPRAVTLNICPVQSNQSLTNRTSNEDNSCPQSVFSVYEFNDLIANIHLYDELQCSYNMMSTYNPKNPSNDRSYIDYTHSYCNNIELGSNNINYESLYYNDNLIRSSIINVTDNYTFNDFYSNTKVLQYYTDNNIQVVEPKFLDSKPVLVYEKYLYGIGCPFISSPESHIKKYKDLPRLKDISITIIIFSIITFDLGIVFLIFRLFNNCFDYRCTYFLTSGGLFFALSVTIIISIVYLIYGYNMFNYFKDFNYFCQIDYSGKSGGNLNKASMIEIQLINDLGFALSLCLVLVIIEIICLVFLAILYGLNCSEHKITFRPIPRGERSIEMRYNNNN